MCYFSGPGSSKGVSVAAPVAGAAGAAGLVGLATALEKGSSIDDELAEKAHQVAVEAEQRVSFDHPRPAAYGGPDGAVISPADIAIGEKSADASGAATEGKAAIDAALKGPLASTAPKGVAAPGFAGAVVSPVDAAVAKADAAAATGLAGAADKLAEGKTAVVEAVEGQKAGFETALKGVKGAPEAAGEAEAASDAASRKEFELGSASAASGDAGLVALSGLLAKKGKEAEAEVPASDASAETSSGLGKSAAVGAGVAAAAVGAAALAGSAGSAAAPAVATPAVAAPSATTVAAPKTVSPPAAAAGRICHSFLQVDSLWFLAILAEFVSWFGFALCRESLSPCEPVIFSQLDGT